MQGVERGKGRTFAVLGVAGGRDGRRVREAELALLELCEDAGARCGFRGCFFCLGLFLERVEAGFLALDVLLLGDWCHGRGSSMSIEYRSRERGREGGRGRTEVGVDAFFAEEVAFVAGDGVAGALQAEGAGVEAAHGLVS